jgi:hypothetical protein
MADDAIIVVPNIPNVTIATPGPQGPAGGQIFYVHTQAVSSAVWTINHNLNG